MTPRRTLHLTSVVLVSLLAALSTRAVAQPPAHPAADRSALLDRIASLRAEVGWLELELDARRKPIKDSVEHFHAEKKRLREYAADNYQNPLLVLRALARARPGASLELETQRLLTLTLMHYNIETDWNSLEDLGHPHALLSRILKDVYQIEFPEDADVEEQVTCALQDRNVPLGESEDVFQALFEWGRTEELKQYGRSLSPGQNLRQAWINYYVHSRLWDERAELKRSREEFTNRARTLARKRLELEDLERQYRASTNSPGAAAESEPTP